MQEETSCGVVEKAGIISGHTPSAPEKNPQIEQVNNWESPYSLFYQIAYTEIDAVTCFSLTKESSTNIFSDQGDDSTSNDRFPVKSWKAKNGRCLRAPNG